MPIDNPQAVRWSNERTRTAANALASVFYRMEKYLDDRTAQGISAVMTPLGDTIVDGSATDGRAPITGQDEADLAALMTTLRNAFRANNNARLTTVLKISVNPEG